MQRPGSRAALLISSLALLLSVVLLCLVLGLGSPLPARLAAQDSRIEKMQAELRDQRNQLDSLAEHQTAAQGRGAGEKFQETDRCGLPPAAGPCRARLDRFYHDPATASCRPFSYSGCAGNSNNFLSEAACNQACLGRERPDLASSGGDGGGDWKITEINHQLRNLSSVTVVDRVRSTGT